MNFGISQYIPLPPGIWEVAAVSRGRNNENDEWNAAILYQSKNGRMANIVEIWANTDAGRYGYVDDDNCSRDDMHFRESLPRPLYRADCYWVNHYRMSIDKQNDNDQMLIDAYQYGESKGLARPLAAVGPGYWKSSSIKYIWLQYYIDPQAYGFEEPKRLDWSTSDWHPQYIHSDPEKGTFINKLIDWAKTAHPIVIEGFNGQTVSLPPFPE